MHRPHSAMRQIREVLRLAQAKSLSPTEIAIAAHLPRTTVRNYLSRAAAAGLSWPLPDDLDDRGLEERLFGRPADRLAVSAEAAGMAEIDHPRCASAWTSTSSPCVSIGRGSCRAVASNTVSIGWGPAPC